METNGAIHHLAISNGSLSKDFPHNSLLSNNQPDYKAYVTCGGFILSPLFGLNATHCFHGITIKELVIAIGVTESQDFSKVEKYAIQSLYVPPSYNPEQHGYDIAVIKIKTPLKLGKGLNAITIALS
ncbi:coagulation factor X-like [Brevipalpus obovatus]|uniref:coagulation factor X-like n=1 Tax=Brevipalpus obovatus TaxID=246614 RepID=UPI003D9F1856